MSVATFEEIKHSIRWSDSLKNKISEFLNRDLKIDGLTPPISEDIFVDEIKKASFVNNIPPELLKDVSETTKNAVTLAANYHKEFFGVDNNNLLDGYFILDKSKETYEVKYQLKGKDGSPVEKSVYDTFSRVALAIALAGYVNAKLSFTDLEYSIDDVEDAYKNYFTMMAMGLVTGAGRIMANAGASYFKPSTTLINCTVMKQIPDSMEGIMDVLADAAVTLKSGAGVGYAFSTIRPKGALVSGAGAATSGVLSFMDIYDQMCHTIESAGGRRGAQMATLHVAHPEIRDYIVAKKEPGRLRYFNLSVFAPDSFFDAVKNDKKWNLWFWEKTNEFVDVPDNVTKSNPIFTVGETTYYLVFNEYTPFDAPDNVDKFVFDKGHVEVKYNNANPGQVFVKKVYETISAKELYDEILKTTYDFGEPGILYLDTINGYNPINGIERQIATNPCGEVPLNPSGSCLLGSIYLHRFVKRPFSSETGTYVNPEDNFDFKLLVKVVRIMNEFLDSVNVITNLPLPSLRKEAFVKRRHGLGVTGYADMLSALELPYGDDVNTNYISELVFATIEAESFGKSNVEIAEKYGPGAFINGQYHGYTEKDFWESTYVKSLVKNFKRLLKYTNNAIVIDTLKEFIDITKNKPKVRYSHSTSIAPTGTISLTFGNNIANGIEPVYSLVAVRNIIKQGKKTKESVKIPYFISMWYKNITGNDITEKTPDKWPSWAKTATLNVTVEDHLVAQEIAQRYTSQSISKTVNLPVDYSFDDFRRLYLDGFKRKLKGLTSFRFNPAFSIGVLATMETLSSLKVRFSVRRPDGTVEVVESNGLEDIEYDGDVHNAASLFEAIKENKYGKYSLVEDK